MARRTTPKLPDHMDINNSYRCCSALPFANACLSQAESLWRRYPGLAFYSPNRLCGYLRDIAQATGIAEADLDNGVGLFTAANYRTSMKRKFDKEIAAEFVVLTGQHRALASLGELIENLPAGSVVDVTGIPDDLWGGTVMPLSRLDLSYKYIPQVPIASKDWQSYNKAFKSIEEFWSPEDRAEILRLLFIPCSWRIRGILRSLRSIALHPRIPTTGLCLSTSISEAPTQSPFRPSIPSSP